MNTDQLQDAASAITKEILLGEKFTHHFVQSQMQHDVLSWFGDIHFSTSFDLSKERLKDVKSLPELINVVKPHVNAAMISLAECLEMHAKHFRELADRLTLEASNR